MRVYVCGPTVYGPHPRRQRPPVRGLLGAQAIPRAAGPAGPAGLATSPTSTTRSTTRPAPRGCRAPSWRSATRAAYVEDTDRLGLGRPDAEPTVTETMPEIVALIADLIERADWPTRRLATSTSASARFPGYGRLSGRRLDEMVSSEPGEGKEHPLDFALWKGHKPDEDAWWESPWGPGRPGWHIECSAMAEALLGTGVRGPRRRHRPGLPPPRERDRPDRGRPRRAARAHLDAQRDARAGRRQDEQERRQHRPAGRGARPLAARGRAGLLPDQPLPLQAAVHRRAHGRGRRPWSSGCATASARSTRASPRPGTGTDPAPGRGPSSSRAPASSPPSRTTSARPRPSPRCSTLVRAGNAAVAGERPGRRPAPRGPAGAGRAPRRAGPGLGGRGRRPGRRAGRGHGPAGRPRGRARGARLRPRGRAPDRDRRRSAGSCATRRRGRRSTRREPHPAAEVVYGRNPVRELIAAGRRPVREVWALPELAAEPWLGPARAAAAHPGRAGPGLRQRRPPGRRGASAGPIPTPSPAAVLAAPAPVVCLDGAQDPRNLGAVARVADGGGRGRAGHPASGGAPG